MIPNLAVAVRIATVLLGAGETNDLLPWSVETSKGIRGIEWSFRYRLAPDFVDAVRVGTGLRDQVEDSVRHNIWPSIIVKRPTLCALRNRFSTLDISYYLAFTLAPSQQQVSAVWYAPSPLVIENPHRPSFILRRTDQIQRLVEGHRLFSLNEDRALQVERIEVDLLSEDTYVTLWTKAKRDPHCAGPLSRYLEDYDLSPTVKVVGFERVEQKYHASVAYLGCFWTFEYRF